MDYDIEWINDSAPTVEYDADRQLEFEAAHGLADGEDIGGLMVYAEGRAVYDYENWCGWVRG